MALEETRAVLDALTVPALVVGAGQRITHINAAATRIFGSGSVGRHYTTALRQPPLLDAIEAVLSGQAGRNVRFFQTRNTRDLRYEVSVMPAIIQGQRAVVVSLTDITDVEEAGQSRRDFVANVSHELKTPLTAISGFIETLLGAARDDPAARDRFLGIMSREAARMNRLVSDLLSLSRVEAEARQRPTERIDLAEPLRMALVRLQGMAEEKGVNVEIQAPDNEAFYILGDSEQLMQVFLNLIENAVKYGGSGGRVTLRMSHVEHDLALRGPAVLAEVIDYGEGIADHHLPRLTERFYRVDDHRARELGGTGLGLAIVKHIVNRHRGRLKIESAPGQGSRFSIYLARA